MKSTLLSRAADPSAFALAAYALGWRQTLASWPVLMGRCLFYVLIMLIFSALWDKVAAERLPGTLAASLPASGLVIYVGVTEWITLSIVAVHLRLEDDIRSGGLEPHLTRPKSFLIQRLFEAFGGMSVRLVFLGTTGLALLAVTGRGALDIPALLAIAVLGFFGATIGVLLYALCGLTAFWMRRVLPVVMIVQKLMFLMGGLFAPITLYPEWLYRLCEPTPFAAHIFFAGLMTFAPSAEAFLRGLALQALWIAILALLCAAVWRNGLRRVLREGG
jgi:ABC-2 type transport system permease protein